jgi:uncharacterized protein
MNTRAILNQTAHRPWPLQSSPWVMQMGWRDLAFLHWPLPASVVRPHVPPELELDLWDGQSWIGVVPFWMEEVKVRWAPPIPTTHRFPELNVRTYVKARGRTGVWFFSLDATSRVAVRAARCLHLPYFDADIKVDRRGDVIEYTSTRTHRGAAEAIFNASYRAKSGTMPASPDSLEHWLMERYCLFSKAPGGKTAFLDVHHPPWPLQEAEAEIRQNTLLEGFGIRLPGIEPLAHFAARLDVLAWRPLAIQ